MTGSPNTSWTEIAAAAQGDRAAEEAFHARYRGPVVAYLRARGLGEVAEDLAQEVFLRLFCAGALERADGAQGRFRSFLLGLARNVAREYVRTLRAQKRAHRSVALEEGLDVAADQPAPDSVFEREWCLTLLTHALDRLREEHPAYHASVKAHCLEGKPQAQVADELGKRVSDVRNYVHRGRRKLLAYVQHEVRASTTPETYAAELQLVAGYLGGA